MQQQDWRFRREAVLNALSQRESQAYARRPRSSKNASAFRIRHIKCRILKIPWDLLLPNVLIMSTYLACDLFTVGYGKFSTQSP